MACGSEDTFCLAVLKTSITRYLVIDAGWFKGDAGNWDNRHRDWISSQKLLPTGLAATGDPSPPIPPNSCVKTRDNTPPKKFQGPHSSWRQILRAFPRIL